MDGESIRPALRCVAERLPAVPLNTRYATVVAPTTTTLVRADNSSISGETIGRHSMQPLIGINKTRGRLRLQLLGLIAVFALAAVPVALSQPQPQPQPQLQPQDGAAAPVAVPGFWDPRRRPERPDLSRVTLIRFLTENDYPPFNHAGPDGNPAGFNVDLARMICEELKIACTIQMRRFDTLIDSLVENRGDAVIASLAVTEQTRARVDFSDPYYRTPARFVSKREFALDLVRPELLEGRKIAVVSGTAHEAYLKSQFTEADIRSFPDAGAAREALKRGEVELLFGDGISLAFWLNGTASEGCCAFRGGSFSDNRYFGEGVGIAVKKGNDTLRLGFNWALFRLWERGRFSDLWLRYFPISPF
jgi:polar amino acid transport system substrate-binding protein